MRRPLLLVILGGFVIGALLGAVMLLNTDAQRTRVVTSGKALIGGPFELAGKDGKTVTDKDFRGRYMLVFFGFTHCPDICPAELQVMSAALEDLGADADKVVPIFITLDPERDTPEAVTAYVQNFGTNFVGLTGSPEAIEKAAKAYRVTYQKFQDESMGEDYSIDHSALVYLMGPDGAFVTHIPYGTPPKKMAETLRRYL
ncbi:MAG: SCO family protein [Methyloceanibacter sp.]|jgi:protein SCO1/2|uniref:SCO family protein n=1 Tax=Methyloceanibacter sp. TaxID=1965321 RepID=UPI0035630D77